LIRATSSGKRARPPDLVGLLARQDLRELAFQDGVDGAAVSPDSEGVTDTVSAVSVAKLDCVQFEAPHLAVRAVGQHDRQGDAIETGFDCDNLCHGAVSLQEDKLRGRGKRMSR
jgi:hypothetical protein